MPGHHTEREHLVAVVPISTLRLSPEQIKAPYVVNWKSLLDSATAPAADAASAVDRDGLRCRFAPSPTGYLHVGSAHSALCNWLFAQANDAAFLLRIEDTDAERNRPELTDNILEMLRWLGLDWDGEPLHQSDRFDEYAAAADRLIEAGVAYWCDCTPEQVQARNKERGGQARLRRLLPRPRSRAGTGSRLAFPRAGRRRHRMGRPDPRQGHLRQRGHRGLRRRPFERQPDVLPRQRRGRRTRWISRTSSAVRTMSTARRSTCCSAPRSSFGEPPAFAHLPLLVNAQRKKLSKRRDDVSMATYKERGFLPEAMRNYLSLLGWGPPDGVEVRPIEEIVDLFRLEDVNPSPAFFDLKKLEHINGEWIRRLDIGRLRRARARVRRRASDERAALPALGSLAQTAGEGVERVARVLRLGRRAGGRSAAWDKAMKLRSRGRRSTASSPTTRTRLGSATSSMLGSTRWRSGSK